MIGHLTKFTFRLFWSPEDNEWVAICDQMESLSWLDHDPVEAIEGVVALVSEFTAGEMA